MFDDDLDDARIARRAATRSRARAQPMLARSPFRLKRAQLAVAPARLGSQSAPARHATLSLIAC